ncbi:acyl carrier protein [Teredinibacter turnerae]|uniref:acyl carrier protein n=1 Tax=Teredinibacter turnerae TaxID=2426 RepID=UPI00036139F9|nr:acyl carrier protein [Teredinibacter turnerae]
MSMHDQLAALIESLLDIDVEELTADSHFKDLPGWDSVNAMRLIAHIETEFAIKLPIKEYLKAETLADVQTLIARAA